jgi:pentatricopeptide repeat protein
MEMLTDTTLFSIITNVGYSLRFELTFGCALLLLWFMGHFASRRQQPQRSTKHAVPFLANKPQKKSNSPRDNIKVQQRVPRDRDTATGELERPLGRVEDIDPAQLRNPLWLMTQVVQFSKTEVRRSIAMYRAALQAGLKLENAPVDVCQKLFEALVLSAIRAGHMEDAMQLLGDLQNMQNVDASVVTSLFGSVAKLCTSKHSFKECLAVYDLMSKKVGVTLNDKTIWSCLLFCSIEVRAYNRSNFFFEKLKSCGMPSQKDYGNMVRLGSLQGDWHLSLQLIHEMQQAAVDIDSVIYNTALATCVSAGQVREAEGLLHGMEQTAGLADVVTYNTLMKGYAKIGLMPECFQIFERLKSKGVTASQVTYGILLDGYINENQLDKAAEIFNRMIEEGGTMNTVLFTTLIKGFARAGEVDQAMKVYEQMRTERNVTPDLITFSILIKANCDADRLEEALKLMEVMANLNLRPDEVVFNNLLSGCARQGNSQLGKRLYSDMVDSGIRPSNATFSILIRFHHQCKSLDDAVDMLKNEPAKHRVDPEPRLFLQLIQSCIRERQGRRAVEVYEMMAERSSPTASTHGSIISTCTKLNMFDTAAEILALAAAKGSRVDTRDANALLDSAMRKHKTQVAGSITTSMSLLGLTVDSKLVKARH